jgi:TetR/AcrR family transcriptional regulator, cholesterol catabolism regulator
MQRADVTDEPRPSAKWLARREAIVDTSARVIARGGYHGTGIAELCAANGLGKGALYHYIGSKEELLAAIHDRVMDEVLQAAERVRRSAQRPSAKLAMLGEEQLGIISRYPDHVWVFLHDFHALTGERAQEFRRRRHEFEQAVEEIIREGTESGEFRVAEPRLTALAWLGMYNWAYLWLRADGPLAAHNVAHGFAEIFLRGIARSAPDSL